jgi:hypothetical protein
VCTRDYGKTGAYLVVINLSDRALDPPMGSRAHGPVISIWPGVRTYMIPVRARPPESSASKLGKASPVTVSREDLVNPDGD